MIELQRLRGLRRVAADVTILVVAYTVNMVFWNGDRDMTGGGRLPVWVVPAVAVGPCLALLLRHRFPLLVWVTTWLYTGVNLIVPWYFPFSFLLVAVYTVARWEQAPAARLVLVASALPMAVFSYRYARPNGQFSLGELSAAAAIWFIFLSVDWGVGRLLHAREQHARAEREQLATEAEKALAAQRLQLARELHDSVTGAVTGIILHAGAARALCTDDDPQVRNALEVIEQAGARAMTELHSMLGLLRSTEPGATTARLAEIDHLLDAARTAGLQVRSEVTGTARPLASEADLSAYRMVQESLTNAAKHAGRGAAVTLSVDWTGPALDLTVRSSGGAAAPGVAALSTGNGLRGLRERFDELGGEFTCGPDADGWLVHASLPFVPADTPAAGMWRAKS